jgi:hypothetical protein
MGQVWSRWWEHVAATASRRHCTTPSDNDQAGRDLRLATLVARVSNGFRTMAGARLVATRRSARTTARRQGRTAAAAPRDMVAVSRSARRCPAADRLRPTSWKRSDTFHVVRGAGRDRTDDAGFAARSRAGAREQPAGGLLHKAYGKRTIEADS